MVFLVAERLDRCGVERLDVALLRQIDGEIGDDGLARAGRRRHQHVAVRLQGLVGLPLELVEFERQRPRELFGDRLAPFLVAAEGLIPLRGRGRGLGVAVRCGCGAVHGTAMMTSWHGQMNPRFVQSLLNRRQRAQASTWRLCLASLRRMTSAWAWL